MDRYSIALKKEPPPISPAKKFSRQDLIEFKQNMYGTPFLKTAFDYSLHERRIIQEYTARLESTLRDQNLWQGVWEVVPYREPEVSPIRRTFE